MKMVNTNIAFTQSLQNFSHYYNRLHSVKLLNAIVKQIKELCKI